MVRRFIDRQHLRPSPQHDAYLRALALAVAETAPPIQPLRLNAETPPYGTRVAIRSLKHTGVATPLEDWYLPLLDERRLKKAPGPDLA